MRQLISIFAASALVALSGCKALTACEGPTDVGEGGASIPPLRVPVGLAEPNTQEALRVPELNEPEAPRSDGKCLDQPPSYFPNRRVGAESPKETQPDAKPQSADEQQPKGEQAEKPEATSEEKRPE